MKTIRHTIFGCLLVVQIVGCSSEGNTNIVLSEDQLPKATILQAEYIPLSANTSILDMAYSQGRLLLSNLREDSLFMLFDTNNFTMLSSWGRVGRGGTEYAMNPKICSNPDGGFFVYDAIHQRIDNVVPDTSVTVKSDFVQGECPSVSQSIAIDPKYRPFKMIFDRFDAKQRSVVCWNEGEQAKNIYGFPDLENLISTAKSGSLCVNFEKNRVIYAYLRLRRFDILDTLGNMVRSVSITPNHNIEAPGERSPNDYTYYFDAWAGPNSFFLYYVGYTSQTLNQSVYNHTFIEEYDYEGNPITRYEIDQFVRNFCPIANNRFVCEAIGNGDYPLVVFGL